MISKSCYVFIDSSNLFYGGKRRLGWRVDYLKLFKYLKRRYRMKKIFYYSGVEAHGFEPLLSSLERYPVESLYKYLQEEFKKADREEKESLQKDISRAKFLRKIEEFGYTLRLKPIKHLRDFKGRIKSKSNCDVDLTLDAIRLEKEYDTFILLSGDGDFEILLRYLREKGKNIVVIANSDNTARIIKDRYQRNFIDFSRIKEVIKE